MFYPPVDDFEDHGRKAVHYETEVVMKEATVPQFKKMKSTTMMLN